MEHHTVFRSCGIKGAVYAADLGMSRSAFPIPARSRDEPVTVWRTPRDRRQGGTAAPGTARAFRKATATVRR